MEIYLNKSILSAILIMAKLSMRLFVVSLRMKAKGKYPPVKMTSFFRFSNMKLTRVAIWQITSSPQRTMKAS